MIFKGSFPLESGVPLLFNEQAAKAKTAKHAIRQAIIFFMEILLTNTMEIKMKVLNLIGELDTEGDQCGGNGEKRNGRKGKDGGEKMGE